MNFKKKLQFPWLICLLGIYLIIAYFSFNDDAIFSYCDILMVTLLMLILFYEVLYFPFAIRKTGVPVSYVFTATLLSLVQALTLLLLMLPHIISNQSQWTVLICSMLLIIILLEIPFLLLFFRRKWFALFFLQIAFTGFLALVMFLMTTGARNNLRIILDISLSIFLPTIILLKNSLRLKR